MAPLPDNNTDCFWLDYTDGQNPHSLLVRFNGGGANVPNVMSSVDQFFTALDPILYAITVNGARWREEGSTISQPLIWEGAAGYGNFAMPSTLAPRQVCFLGRDSAGRRVRWFVFGWDAAPPTAFRIGAGGATEFADARAVIVAGNADGIWLTIAGLDPVLYGYVDINYNSYYEEKTR